MSHRLNIELTAGDAVLASCYYHGCAFTDQALDLAEVITKTYDETFGGAEPDIFTGIYFDHIDMVRRIIEGCPNGLRLRNGDVIEWI